MKSYKIACEIADQMNDKDVATFDAGAWRDAVSGMLVGEWEGADLAAIMGDLKQIVMGRFCALVPWEQGLAEYDQPVDAETDHFADDVRTWNRLAELRA